jgi:hypothetical protein
LSVGWILDTYDRRARLAPALLAVAPIGIFIAVAIDARSVLTWASSALASCGIAYALAMFARDRGKRLEQALYSKWGGKPSTVLLRHGNQHFDSFTKHRYHEVLAAGIARAMPTPEQEGADPTSSDALYGSASVWLIERTRDRKAFPLVFAENVAYGFRRNALGIRPIGISIALAVMLLAAAMWLGPGWPARWTIESFRSGALLTAVAAALFTLGWGLLVDEDAVKRAAFAYADQLIRSCEKLRTGVSQGPVVKRRGKASSAPAAEPKDT